MISNPPFTIIRNARQPKPSSQSALSSQTSFSPEKSMKILSPEKIVLSSYNRKEKSLEELSRKFLQMFLNSCESFISLDRITDSLGVERRRIYDIINILESLNLVTRKGKNNYRWNGFSKVYETIRSFESIKQQTNSVLNMLIESNKNHFGKESQPIKREKSLKLLSIGFLSLFLNWKQTMSLEEAAKRLNEGQNVEDHKIKTKIRRLYDIANVFKSLGLIRKTLMPNKKPAFTWLGTPGLDEFVESNKQMSPQISKTSENEIKNKDFLVKCLLTLLENKQAKSPQKQSFVTPIIKKTLTIIVINFIYLFYKILL